MSLGLPPLPEFADDWLLGASDLNRIGQAQAYVNQVIQRANVPFFYMAEDETRYICHRHRYLHWEVTSASGASLQVNGNTVDTADATSGYCDLNGEGLVEGEAYSVVWTGAATTCIILYEFPNTSGTLALPQTTPTISDTVTADELNKVVENTQYLIDNVGAAPFVPFMSRKWYVAPSKELNFTMTHLNRYLYFYGEGFYSGTQGSDDFTINWKINDTTFRAFNSDGNNDDGGAYFNFNFFYDLQGTDHTDNSYTASGLADAGTWSVADGSTFGLSAGDDYKITIDVAEAHNNTILHFALMVELAAKVIS